MASFSRASEPSRAVFEAAGALRGLIWLASGARLDRDHEWGLAQLRCRCAANQTYEFERTGLEIW
jgi:hypothetical protein